MSYESKNNQLLRIGVFYDGNFFAHVSNYYTYVHERKSRISVSGLHRFIVEEISRYENIEKHRCRIVDAHYFKGRLSAHEAQERNALFRERQFDEVLMREGIVAHYLPISMGMEKGIDVWLALEALELAIHKHFDIVVLIAGDGDYLPLVRKLNTLGTRVSVLGWDFEYTDNQGNQRQTKTAQSLLNEANYPILISSIIEDRARTNDPLIDNLFIRPSSIRPQAATSNEEKIGIVDAIRQGYGFIHPQEGGENLFFHYTDLDGVELFDLIEGDCVRYVEGTNERGRCARRVRLCE